MLRGRTKKAARPHRRPEKWKWSQWTVRQHTTTLIRGSSVHTCVQSFVRVFLLDVINPLLHSVTVKGYTYIKQLDTHKCDFKVTNSFL